MIQPIKGKSHLVIKRDGREEPYSRDKLYKVILWACDGSKLFADELINAVNIKIYNRIHITKLYDEVIATASNLISDLYPQWESIAKNLYVLKLHKELGCKRTDYPLYYNVIKSNERANLYSTEILDIVNDLDTLAGAIKPERDNLFTFGGLNLFVQKYCNHYKGKLFELPQHVYMRVAMQLMYKDGIAAIIDKYNQLSLHQVTEATPKMVNSLRPNAAMFSCCLTRPTDSQEGINESINMLTKESKFSGGCAWDVSLIRAKGAPIKGNNGTSSGTKPYIKALQEAISGYNQGNTRSSAAVVTFDAFHYEAPEIAQMKLENGKDEDRARRLQYSVRWHRKLSEAVQSNEDIYLIDPHKAQDLFESYGNTWNELYDKYSRNTRIHKRKYNARELAFTLTNSSAETGNLYYFFIDNTNEQDISSGFIPSSNLCQEVVMVQEPIKQASSSLIGNTSNFSFTGDMALCNLSSINLMQWVQLSSTEKQRFMYILVKSMDNAINNSFYVNPLGKKHATTYRDIGIGVSNYANLLASNRLSWSSEGARKLTHEVFEEISYYSIAASIQLAKERSRCPIFEQTKWAKGLLPHELSILSKSNSELNYPLRMNWDALRSDLIKYGIRNSRLTAIAPTATSGKCINATEGIDAPVKLKTITEGTYTLPFVVPNLQQNREYYETRFNVSNKDVIELAAIRQKFLTMSQSVSLAYSKLTSAYEHVSNIIYAEKLGLKSIYYTYTKKDDMDEIICESCSS